MKQNTTEDLKNWRCGLDADWRNLGCCLTYNILSPDSFPIFPEDFDSLSECLVFFEKWCQKYHKQGFYASNYGHISPELVPQCSILTVNGEESMSLDIIAPKFEEAFRYWDDVTALPFPYSFSIEDVNLFFTMKTANQ